MTAPLRRVEAVKIAQAYKRRLEEMGVPISQMFLFGSMALDVSGPDSDIDIAIVGPSFRGTRLEEAVVCRKATWDIDTRIEPICLRPGDITNKYFSLSREIRENGVEL